MRDPIYAARMAYCGPRGIPLSAFLGWSRLDQEAALGWAAHEAARCSQCGTHPDDTETAHPHLRMCDGCRKLAQLTESSIAQNAGRGAHAELMRGSVKACPVCSS